ncbi:MAG: hypothetical protein ACE5M4_00330 [Anaerolineales bacterium]
MKIDRSTLAWLALGGSLLLCFPCGCFNGILTAVGAASLMSPDIEAGITAAENTYYAGIFGGLALAALIPGAVLFSWGLRTLRQELDTN